MSDEDKIAAFKAHVTEASKNPAFVHHPWFAEWHLKVVEQIALELCDFYPQADRSLVAVMAWLHDYAKILDKENERERALIDEGRAKLIELGFDETFASKAADYVEWMDKRAEVDLREAPIEVQIVSSADGMSHLSGPFMYLYWQENADKPFIDLMAGNYRKAKLDWERKIVLPEARRASEKHYQITQSQNSPEQPARYIPKG